MSQASNPTGDLAINGGDTAFTTSPLWSKLNDASDATFISGSVASPAKLAFRVSLSSISTPLLHSPFPPFIPYNYYSMSFTIRYRVNAADANTTWTFSFDNLAHTYSGAGPNAPAGFGDELFGGVIVRATDISNFSALEFYMRLTPISAVDIDISKISFSFENAADDGVGAGNAVSNNTGSLVIEPYRRTYNLVYPEIAVFTPKVN